jgi:hypothetical protein
MGECKADMLDASPWEMAMPSFARQGSRAVLESLSSIEQALKPHHHHEIKDSDPEEVKEQVKKHKREERCAAEFSRKKRQRMKLIVASGIIWNILTLVLNVSAIVVGSIYYQDLCTNNLPLWLILEGASEIALLLLGFATNSGKHGGAYASIYGVLKLANVAWLIVGAVWTFSISSSECTDRVYSWSFIFVAVNLAIIGAQLLLITIGVFINTYAPKKPERSEEEELPLEEVQQNSEAPKLDSDVPVRKSSTIGSDEFGRRVLLGRTRSDDIKALQEAPEEEA